MCAFTHQPIAQSGGCHILVVLLVLVLLLPCVVSRAGRGAGGGGGRTQHGADVGFQMRDLCCRHSDAGTWGR